MAVKCLVGLIGRGWRCGSTLVGRLADRSSQRLTGGTRSCDYHWVILHLFVVWTSAMGASGVILLDLGVQTRRCLTDTYLQPAARSP